MTVRKTFDVRYKAILLILTILVSGIAGTSCRKKQAVEEKPQTFTDQYSMGIDSPNKPELRYFLVRLKGDNGVSIIDLDGNVISRNFAPVTNSQGTISVNSRMTPVLDSVFCVVRYKETNGKSRRSMTVYRNPSNPTPIPGLTDLYSANIINPNLFPICKRGERIKFVDSEGNVKFTVMPIDGKEPHSVYPLLQNGLIIVEIDDRGKNWEKEGAIDTNGNWVIYPEWDRLEQNTNGTIVGWKDEKQYIINRNGEAVVDPDQDKGLPWYGSQYLIETIHENGKSISNIYDLKKNYITTLDNADFIRPNTVYPDILLVRRDFGHSNNEDYQNLVDISKSNAVISKNYDWMEELPEGNYLGRYRAEDDIYKCWYVKADGTATPLPDNSRFPLQHPTMGLFYKSNINRFIVEGKNGAPDYICDFNGNKVGNILIDEYYNIEWEAEPVKSSYWRKYVYGEAD